jgi:tRNA(Arg) A34 adenosine deaminase TadA
MLGVMSYMYANLNNQPSPGYDISAGIAWNVGNPDKTPEFVFNTNRNYEKQGEIHHAEINTLRSAYDKMYHFDVSPRESDDERHKLYTDDFKNAVLYTTLEPCPMCLTTMILAKVPSAIFCMDDPGLRDLKTHDTSVKIPTAFYGRQFAEQPSDLPACREANKAMWQTAEHSQATTGSASTTAFSITSYIHEKREDIFRPAWDGLRCYKVTYPENEGLLSALQKATGDTSPCGK